MYECPICHEPLRKVWWLSFDELRKELDWFFNDLNKSKTIKSRYAIYVLKKFEERFLTKKEE
jgi:hypothetical protein